MNIIDRLTTAHYSAEKFRILTFMWMPRHPYRSIPPPIGTDSSQQHAPQHDTVCCYTTRTAQEQPEEQDKEVMCWKNEDP